MTKNKHEIPLTDKEQDQISEVAKYFGKYPINYFGENTVKNKLCALYGYNPLRDKTKLNALLKGVYRERMSILAKQNPGYQFYSVINHSSTTEAEAEDRLISGG